MAYLEYDLFLHGYVNRWLTTKDSGVLNAPESLVENVFFQEKEDFLAQWRIYFPFNQAIIPLNKIKQQGAVAFLRSPQPEEGSFIFWGDPTWQISCNNIPIKMSCPLILPLQKGINMVLIAQTDQKEEAFALEYKGNLALHQVVPVGRQDIKRIREVESALSSMCFSRNHYSFGNVMLRCEKPSCSFPLEIKVENTDFSVSEVESEAGKLFILGAAQEFPLGFHGYQMEAAVDKLKVTCALPLEIAFNKDSLGKGRTLFARKNQTIRFLASFSQNQVVKVLASLWLETSPMAMLSTASFWQEMIAPLDMAALENILQEKRGIHRGLEPPLLLNILGLIKIFDPFAKRNRLPSEFKHKLEEIFLLVQSIKTEHTAQQNYTFLEVIVFFLLEKDSPNLWINRLKNWLRDEINQKSYQDITGESLEIRIASLGFLYGLIIDVALKDLTKTLLDKYVNHLILYSHQGCFRNTSTQIDVLHLIAIDSTDLAFLHYLLTGRGSVSCGGLPVLSLALSDYTITKEIEKFSSLSQGEDLVVTEPLEADASMYGYRTSAFMMTSLVDYRVGGQGRNVNPFSVIFTSTAKIWVNHPDFLVSASLPSAAPWVGNSILPQVNQYKGFASLIYLIPKEHPIDYTHAYFPTMEFDLCQIHGNWIFAYKDNGYCGVYCNRSIITSKGTGNQDREFIAQGRKTIWLVRAAGKEEFSSFHVFVRQILASALEVEEDGLSFRFMDPIYGKISSGYRDTD